MALDGYYGSFIQTFLSKHLTAKNGSSKIVSSSDKNFTSGPQISSLSLSPSLPEILDQKRMAETHQQRSKTNLHPEGGVSDVGAPAEASRPVCHIWPALWDLSGSQPRSRHLSDSDCRMGIRTVGTSLSESK